MVYFKLIPLLLILTFQIIQVCLGQSVSIRETENYTTFEISELLTFRVNSFTVLLNGQGLIFQSSFRVFRLTGKCIYHL